MAKRGRNKVIKRRRIPVKQSRLTKVLKKTVRSKFK